MSMLIDQMERDRFVQEQDRNISMIAPAGVGKTTSIVSRIVHLAHRPEVEAIDRLSRLIVVTYSVRAAQQMQQKARAAIRTASVSMSVRRAFQQTFFGTIHSYCVRLLDRFGHYLGLPSPVGLLQNDVELWNRFLLRGLGRVAAQDIHLRELFHFYAPQKLYALGREISPGKEIAVGPLPDFQWGRLFDYRDDTLHASTRRSIVRAQDATRHWSEEWARGERFRPLPRSPESEKAAAFTEIHAETFVPLQDWLRNAALAFGRRVANAYEDFRLSESVMTYDDQVRLALRLLDLPAVRSELASERLSVLLDEAQDTDFRQFEVLRRVAGLGGDSAPQADDQSFCIVGDFQQAIYSPRSDLAMYRRVHDEISAEPRGTSSRLRLTFRCDEAIIDFVNRIFPALLNDSEGQCAFEMLVPREGAGPGQVVRLVCPPEPDQELGEKISLEKRARHEARFVARRIQELGPAGLGAAGWPQVAILCPRKNWLLEIQEELIALGLPVQLHSSNEERRDRAPVAWLTALIWVAAHPEDSFEIAGVLREILGVSDSDMAIYTGGNGDKLRLDRIAPTGANSVSLALKLLSEACVGIDSMPLHRAISRLLDRTRLRERLKSIDPLEKENSEEGLNDFLAAIADRCAEGVTLRDLADELRLGLMQANPAEEEIEDAIQLLTTHKAKGLEWDAVIVPFVFRPIESKSMPYPRVVMGQVGEEIVARDKADYARQMRAFVTGREKQQLQRLLYVMSTRAKKTYVLVDDEPLFAGSMRRSGWSAGELFGFLGGENRNSWKALPEELFPPKEPHDRKSVSDQPESIGASGGPVLVPLPELAHQYVRQAIDRAAVFPRRITPHTLITGRPDLSQEAEPERGGPQEEEELVLKRRENPGVLYGIWWHEFMQTIPWQRTASIWDRKFIDALVRSPDPERAVSEWESFRRSKLNRWLAETRRLVQVELPFLWRENPEAPCLEGVMDLAIYTESDEEWRVIDWKTNRIGPAGCGELVESYRGQINAYVRALRGMLSAKVRGSLYLTGTGEWVPMD